MVGLTDAVGTCVAVVVMGGLADVVGGEEPPYNKVVRGQSIEKTKSSCTHRAWADERRRARDGVACHGWVVDAFSHCVSSEFCQNIRNKRSYQ